MRMFTVKASRKAVAVTSAALKSQSPLSMISLMAETGRYQSLKSNLIFSASITLSRRQLIILESIAQCLLVEFADAGLRHGVNEDDVVGHPPFREALPEVIVDFLFRHRRSPFEGYAGQRSLLPLRVIDCDDRRFGHAGKGHNGVLQVNR